MQCSNCMHYVSANEHQGWCLRYPPSIPYSGRNEEGLPLPNTYSPVAVYQTCGEHKRGDQVIDERDQVIDKKGARK